MDCQARVTVGEERVARGVRVGTEDVAEVMVGCRRLAFVKGQCGESYLVGAEKEGGERDLAMRPLGEVRPYAISGMETYVKKRLDLNLLNGSIMKNISPNYDACRNSNDAIT